MPQHRDLPVALRREPVELDDPALAGERFMAVPGIVAAFERASNVPAIGGTSAMMSLRFVGGAQQPQPPARLLPAFVHVDQHGDDLAGRIGVDLAVACVAAAAHRGHGRPAGKIEAEFFLKRFAELVAFEFVEQRLERRAEADLIDRKTTRTARSSDNRR